MENPLWSLQPENAFALQTYISQINVLNKLISYADTETDQSTGSETPNVESSGSGEVDIYKGVTNDDFRTSAEVFKPEAAKPAEAKEGGSGERSEPLKQPPAKEEVKLPQPLEEKEEDPKAAKEEEVKEGETSPVTAAGTSKGKPGPKRDYTGIDEETARILAKTPNDVFNYFKRTIPALQKELTTLREQTKISGVESLYSNPEGYVLTPEYRQTSQAVENLEAEMAFWEEQAERFANGKEARLLACKEDGDLSKKLTYIYGSPIPKGQEGHTIQKALTQTTMRLEQFKARKANVQQAYTQTQQGFIQEARKAADHYYPTLSNPEGKVKETLDAIRESLGPHGRGFSGELLTRNVYTIKQFAERYVKDQAEITRLNALLKTSKRANPLGGAPDKELTAQGDDIYAGTTNDMFTDR